jgi:hypothetical protein
MSFTDIHQIVPSGTPSTIGNGVVSLSASIDVPVNGIGFDSLMLDAGTIPDTITVGAGQTQRSSQDATEIQIRGSTSTTSGINAMDWSWTTSDHYSSLIAIPLNAATTVLTPVTRRVIIVE